MAISSSGCGRPWPSSALQLLDLLADRARLFLGVPAGGDLTFSPGSSSVRSVLPSRPSLWAIRCEAAARMWAVRAVVALEPDDLGAGEVVLEAQDVVDLGAAPAVDRLVVVADAADVFGRARRRLHGLSSGFGVIPGRGRKLASPESILAVRGHGFRARALRRRPRDDGGVCSAARALRQQPQPEILRDVGVLVLVHQDVLETAPGTARSTSGCSRNSRMHSSSRSPKSAALSTFSRSW